jgi:uncharacterized protein (TIGR03067 family)
MRAMIATALLALAVPCAAAADPKEAAEKLEGTYEVLDFVIGGQSDNIKDEIEAFVIKDGTLTLVIINGKGEQRAKFTLDPSQKPAHIDFVSLVGGKAAGKGIYVVKETDKGLELTIAYTKDVDAERPKDFKGGTGENDIVIKLLRKKK